jgi:glycolate oxidase
MATAAISPTASDSTSQLTAALIGLLGADHVLTDAASRKLYAQDVFTDALPCAAVARPGNSAELAAVVRACTAAGHAVIARGGGMSYTGGLIPQREQTVTIDTQRMNRVLAINREDMHVTVECGCTWQVLHQALEPLGLRTPFWGTLSGSKATVGGGMSQNSIFWGSGKHGFATDSLLSLDVVLADGRILRTGAAALANGTPFLRQYGPDLAGLFAADAGALGIKATVTLKLLPRGAAQRFLSFDFPDFASQTAAMSAVARAGLASECFGFDPYLQQQRLKRAQLMSDIKSLGNVMKQAGGIGKALKEGARVALAGRRFMDNVVWSLHLMIEESCEAAAEHAAGAALAICQRHGGRTIENSIPKLTRANPFGPVNNMIGPDGERWVPVHALVPHSKAAAAYAATQAVFAQHAAAIEAHGIGTGFLVATVSTHVFVLEPVFFWPDSLHELHRVSIDADYLRNIRGFGENLEARAAVTRMKAELGTVYRELGATHMQIGKAYEYLDGIDDTNRRLIGAIKAVVDPGNLINPGALGLGT